MPKLKIILCTLLFGGILSSCSFILEPPANFIAPPVSDKESYQEHMLINGFLGPDENLQVPREMKNPAAQVDLELGPEHSLRKLVFWTKQNGYQVGMTLLVETSDGWALLDQERQSGRSIHYFNSVDLDGDGNLEILLGVESGANRTLHIYKLTREGLQHMDQFNYSRLAISDINGDGKVEIISTLNNLAGSTTMTDVNSYQFDSTNRLQRLSHKTVEGYCHEMEYGPVSPDEKGLYMITSHDTSSIRALLLIYRNDNFEEVLGQDIGYVNALTERQGGIIQDINEDGVLDILTVRYPIDASKREPREYLQIWKEWDGVAGLTNIQAHIDNRSDGYRLQIPLEWLENLHYSYFTEQKDREVRFFDGQDGVGSSPDFSIHTRDAGSPLNEETLGMIPIGMSPSMEKSYYVRINDDQFAGHPLNENIIRSHFKIEGGSSQNGN